MKINPYQVTLIRGPIVYKSGSINNEATPAIGLAYIGGYLLEKGYQVSIIDAIAEGLNKTWKLKKYKGFNCQGISFEEIISLIPPDTKIIGFSGMFSGEWPVTRDLINEVKIHFPTALLIAGGEHITSLSKYSLEDCSALDVCIRGEGENTFTELVSQYYKTGNYKGIFGTGYLDGKQYMQPSKPIIRKGESATTPKRINDISKIPWPYWPEGYLEKFWISNKSYGIFTGKDMPFLLSRGCPYECTFCSNPLMYGNKYTLRDIDDVINEIKFYIDKYDISSITLYDLTAITKKRWIIDFCNRLIKEKIHLNWSLPSGTRSEVLDEEVLGLLKRTGCDYLVYAPESGSADTLVKIKKQISLPHLTQSVLTAKAHKIVTRINLIIGFPHEKWGDIFKTIKYGIKMAFKGVDEIPLFLFSAYPGTEIYDELIKKNLIKINDDYFFSLTSLNGNYLATNMRSFNPQLNQRLLAIVRTVFILMNYLISYLFFPSRIYRTLSNIFRKRKAETVFENRLIDLINKIWYKLSH